MSPIKKTQVTKKAAPTTKRPNKKAKKLTWKIIKIAAATLGVAASVLYLYITIKSLI